MWHSAHVVARLVLAALAWAFISGVPAHAVCDPTTEPDKTDIANARAAVANCDCTAARSHGDYVRCAVVQADATLQNLSCRGVVKRCAARSTCGRPGFVTCCRTRTKNGSPVTKCSTKKDAAYCTPPSGGTACVGSFTSCCDACAAAGCATTTTATTTSTTIPCASYLQFCRSDADCCDGLPCRQGACGCCPL